jgi:hypothetical protein
LIVFQNGHISGALAELIRSTRSADQGSVDRQDHGRESEALAGPMTPPGQRVQLLNAPGSEVGPGQVATWGKATTHRVDALGLKWEADGKSSKHIPFDWSGPQPS